MVKNEEINAIHCSSKKHNQLFDYAPDTSACVGRMPDRLEYCRLFDLNYYHDSDGLPDDFEGTITLFNGKPLYSNPLDPDTDDDGLPDGQEITFRIRPGAEPNEVYVFVWLHSDPNGDDSDGDGYTDNIDEHLLEWDVGDRDLAMFAALAYEDQYSRNGSFYQLNLEQQQYHLYNSASLDELSDRWCVIDYVYQLVITSGDHFSATTYMCDNNLVIAYRGTDEFPFEWIDNFVGYGLNNYHSQEISAINYANTIYHRFVEGKSNVKLYITGHSLGGYLAQVASAGLLLNANCTQLNKIVYFDGMGLDYDIKDAFVEKELIQSRLPLQDLNGNRLSLQTYQKI